LWQHVLAGRTRYATAAESVSGMLQSDWFNQLPCYLGCWYFRNRLYIQGKFPLCWQCMTSAGAASECYAVARLVAFKAGPVTCRHDIDQTLIYSFYRSIVPIDL
jgi:hypothetical protein